MIARGHARRRFAIASLALAAACGPVDGGAALPAPINACPDHPCAAYASFVADGASAKCNSRIGACEVDSQINYTLVVSVPDTSYFAPDTSFVISSTQLFVNPTAGCPSGFCTHLPGVAVQNGQYVVLPSVQTDPTVSYFIGTSAGQIGALPVRVMYRPLADPPSSLQPPPTSDATVVGMPLLPALADVVFPVLGIAGPGGGPNPGFHIMLPPGKYERTIAPEPPYDAFFPPEIASVAVASGVQSVQAGTSLLSALDHTHGSSGQTNPTFDTITRADAQTFDGWTAFVRDQATLRRVSTTVVLGPSQLTAPSPPTYKVVLNTNHHPVSGDALTGTEVVIAPPAGADAAPTLVAPFLAGSLIVPTYPLIAPPASVAGSVTTSAGTALTSATLLFRSKKIYLTTADPSFTTNLSYEARATAIASTAGADVRYSVRLPRGEYDVIVIPSDDGGAAKSVLSLTVTVDVDVQDGKNLSLQTKRGVRGLARVSDGRALAGAEVVATPSSSLSASGVPDERLPRLASTTTELDGSFVLRLDPGTYDIAVRPADGSRLPWVVSPARAILPGDSDLVLTDTIEIPAPIDQGIIIVDPQENPIIRAVVRAFAVPTGGTAYVEIGRTLTDGNGRYELFLAGTPHP